MFPLEPSQAFVRVINSNADTQTFVFERFVSVQGATGAPRMEYATPGPLVAMEMGEANECPSTDVAYQCQTSFVLRDMTVGTSDARRNDAWSG